MGSGAGKTGPILGARPEVDLGTHRMGEMKQDKSVEGNEPRATLAFQGQVHPRRLLWPLQAHVTPTYTEPRSDSFRFSLPASFVLSTRSVVLDQGQLCLLGDVW